MKQGLMNKRMDKRSGKRYLYYLSDKDDINIFYIGLTCNPASRYKNHTYKYGNNIIMTIFKEVVGWEAERMESFVIKRAAEIGFNLANSLNCLVNPYDYPDNMIAFSCFQECVMTRHHLERVNMFKFFAPITKSILSI